MSDHKDQLRSYIDGLGEPISVDEVINRRAERRFRVPAAVLAGAAVVLVPALVLVGLRWLPGGGDEVAETSAPPVSTSAVLETTSTTMETTTTAVGTVVVPNVIGLPVEEAQIVLETAGLEWSVLNERFDATRWGLIVAQGPEPGNTVAPGTVIVIETPLYPTCLDYEPDLEGARSTTVQVLFECAADGFYPDVSTPITRVVAMTGDAIEATLRELLAGPTDEERAMGFTSSFSADSADALKSIRMNPGTPSRLVVDFNDAIILDNISTSHASMYFLAELQANLFQFSTVDEIEFQRDGSCDGFWGMLERECHIVSRSEWETTAASWQAERDLQVAPEDVLGIDDVVGTTFTTQLHNGSQEIMASRSDRFDSDLYYSGFSEIGGWLLDDATTDNLKNWALHVTGQNAEMIWLVESVGHTDEGSMIYTVRAVLEIPRREIEEVMQGDPFVRDGATACTRNGSSDPRLVVVAEVTETDSVISDYMNPLLAWLMDVDGADFVEIPTDGIECLFDLS